jgi:hypothetical protein
MTSPKLIFVASPLRPFIPPHVLQMFPDPDCWQRQQYYHEVLQKNLQHARECCQKVLAEGHTPIAPHLILPQLLDDADPAQREQGINGGLVYLTRADELWYWDDPTEGMIKEIQTAYRLGIPVVYMGNVPLTRVIPQATSTGQLKES